MYFKYFLKSPKYLLTTALFCGNFESYNGKMKIESDDLFFTNRDCNSEVKQENYLRALQAVKNNIKTMMYE